MSAFRKLKDRLQQEGWYVEWNLPCCQSCAWGDVPFEHEEGPFTGESVDLSKVLFNHSQDCEVDYDYKDCPDCGDEGCEACDYVGGVKVLLEEGDFDHSVHGFVCHTPEQQDGSTFCFDGSKAGVKNLKAIIPIIEECGCTIEWNGKGDTRPSIYWEI